jgi:hypothetical protein
MLLGDGIPQERIEAVLRRLVEGTFERAMGHVTETPCYMCGLPENDATCVFCHRTLCWQCWTPHRPDRMCILPTAVLPDHIPLPMRRVPLPFVGCRLSRHPSCKAWE